jgi:multiple sugar transport system permease protein
VARSRRKVLRGVQTAVGIAIVLVLLFPLLWVILSSFQPSLAFYDPVPSLIPRELTLANYAVLGSQVVPLLTTISVALLSALLSLLIGVPAAYALAAFRWRWTPALMLLILVTQTVPGVMIATPLYLSFARLGLLNSIPGLVIADSAAGVPFTILVLTAFIQGLPPALREAAYIDGAGEWRTLLSVIAPNARTAIISAGLFSFLFAWGDFLWAVTLNTNGKITPLSLSLFQFVGAYHIEWGAIMATATIALVPAVVLLVLSQRYISLGLTAGAVKE